jgi:RNA polymerase sigma-70 factor (family 1)
MNYILLTDSELSTLLITGDHKAYEQLYQRYFRLLYTYAYKKLRDEEQAKDIIQEFFTELWHKRKITVFSTNLTGYFFSAVNNRVANYFSRETIKTKYIESFSSFLAAENNATDHLVREKQLMEMIDREIQALPLKMREVFEMSRKQHLSNKEIAEKLAISERTVETQVSNALFRLRTKLGLIVFLLYLFKK